PVLITSCHVSLKPKIGPVTAQTAITTTAAVNTRGRPQNRDALFANATYQLPLCMGRFLDAGTCRRPKAMQLSGRLDPTIHAHHHFYDADAGATTDIPLIAKSLQVGNGASAWHRAGRCPSRDPRPKPLTRSAS